MLAAAPYSIVPRHVEFKAKPGAESNGASPRGERICQPRRPRVRNAEEPFVRTRILTRATRRMKTRVRTGGFEALERESLFRRCRPLKIDLVMLRRCTAVSPAMVRPLEVLLELWRQDDAEYGMPGLASASSQAREEVHGHAMAETGAPDVGLYAGSAWSDRQVRRRWSILGPGASLKIPGLDEPHLPMPSVGFQIPSNTAMSNVSTSGGAWT